MFAWDDETPDIDEALVEHDTLPTDDLATELPGISLESDQEDSPFSCQTKTASRVGIG